MAAEDLVLHQAVAASGGETPLADSRRVYERVPQEVREKFENRKIKYVQNFYPPLGGGWQKSFQTESRADVESFCHRRSISTEWRDGDRLRTIEFCQASAPIAVMNGQGDLLGESEAGEVVIRGEGVTPGYLNNPDAQ